MNQRTFDSAGVEAAMTVANSTGEPQTNSSVSAPSRHRGSEPIWAPQVDSELDENCLQRPARGTTSKRNESHSLAYVLHAGLEPQDPSTSVAAVPSRSEPSELSGQGALFRNQGPVWASSRASHLASNDTFRSDLSNVLQHPTTCSKYDSGVGSRALNGPGMRRSEQDESNDLYPAQPGNFAGAPAERARNTPLLRVPWFQSSTAGDSGRPRG